MANTIIILRGLPGSGKSTLAKKLGGKIFDADTYEGLTKDGVTLNRNYKGLAKVWCEEGVKQSMIDGEPLIVVANPHMSLYSMKFYERQAKKYNYKIRYLHLMNNYGNVHSVPSFKVARMANSYEPHPLDEEIYEY